VRVIDRAHEKHQPPQGLPLRVLLAVVPEYAPMRAADRRKTASVAARSRNSPLWK